MSSKEDYEREQAIARIEGMIETARCGIKAGKEINKSQPGCIDISQDEADLAYWQAHLEKIKEGN